MSFRYSATRILHDDHMATLALSADISRLVLARKTAPARDDAEIARLARNLVGAIEGEISAHFDFEEQALFPVLSEYGDGDLADLLTEEHHVLRDVFRELVPTANASRSEGFSPEGWQAFRRLCAEFVERLQSHIEKEEQALLPSLENALTPEVDAEASARHDI